MGKHRDELDEENRRLRGSLKRWRITAAVLLTLTLAFSVSDIRHWALENWFELGWSEIDEQAPYADEVRAIIRPLRYSGLHALLKKDLHISFDYKDRSWTLHNARSYDDQGRIRLDEGKYGVCGELAAYTYQKLKPILPRNFTMQIVEAVESSYFPGFGSQHYAVALTDLGPPPKTYIADPSSRRYGPARLFQDYKFRRPVQRFHLLNSRDPDARFDLGACTPLIIRKKRMVFLCIEPVSDRYDEGHHVLSLGLIAKSRYEGDRILVLQRGAGKMEIMEDKEAAAQVREMLGPTAYKQLKARVAALFRRAEDEAKSAR